MSIENEMVFGIEDNEEIGVVVYVGQLKVWEEERCLSDHFTPEQEEIRDILGELSLFEEMEGVFVTEEDSVNPDELRDALIEKGFNYDEEFEEKMEGAWA